MSPQSAGYSGTPLAKKLGIVEGSRVVIKNAPDGYSDLLEPIPAGVRFGSRVSKRTDLVQVFGDRKAKLAKVLKGLRKTISPATPVWVSWPKKSSNVPTDVTEGTIREIALPLGFVDVKVCAVNEVWSGLKLVIRKELRENSR